ncbi:helix-turn-helix domain-containing protein [Halorubrum sp. CBA1125]|uniref:helix-turn-helix domain-containing protein n=1 Tax=Halorubrum sp. CBA1125 TaxID=2668072 RepID=UPI0012E77110|nr:helix-turn-helix domain-containing protein [Halorubrum sp. CBA1125]
MSTRPGSIADANSFELPEQQQLRELRCCAGLTIVEVADAGGWHESTVRRWEYGDYSPRLEDVKELLEIYRERGRGER